MQKIREDILNANKTLIDRKEVTVRFSEVDALGIVWHGHYIKYMEDGRESFGNTHGISYLDVKDQGYTIPLVKVLCEYKRSLKYGEKAIIETEYVPTQAAKIIFRYRIYRKENLELAAEGETIQVFLGADGLLCLANPSFYDDWKSHWGVIELR